MKERRFWDIANVLASLKAIVASLVIFAVGLIPSAFTYVLVRSVPSVAYIGWIISAIWMVISLWFWGYLVNKWWGWK